MDLKVGQKWRFIDGIDEDIWELLSVNGYHPRGRCIYSLNHPIKINIESDLTLGDMMSPDVSKWSLIDESNNMAFGYINYPNGVHCTQCNDYNQYVTKGNQLDGTYKCYSCRK